MVLNQVQIQYVTSVWTRLLVQSRLSEPVASLRRDKEWPTSPRHLYFHVYIQPHPLVVLACILKPTMLPWQPSWIGIWSANTAQSDLVTCKWQCGHSRFKIRFEWQIGSTCTVNRASVQWPSRLLPFVLPDHSSCRWVRWEPNGLSPLGANTRTDGDTDSNTQSGWLTGKLAQASSPSIWVGEHSHSNTHTCVGKNRLYPYESHSVASVNWQITLQMCHHSNSKR